MDRLETLKRMANCDSFSSKMKKLYKEQYDREWAQQEQVRVANELKAKEIIAVIYSCDRQAIEARAEKEYTTDYTIEHLPSCVRLTSLVAREYHERVYDFDTFAAAWSKKVVLMKYRLYNEYVRSEEVDRLAELVG